MNHKISTTMQPDKQIEVEETEYLDLKRQGLIAADTPEQAAAPAPAITSKAAKPAASKEG